MLNVVKIMKSGNSLMFPITREMCEVADIREGDKFVVKISPMGFVANKVNVRSPELIFPMTYEQLIADAKPDHDNLLPIEEMIHW